MVSLVRILLVILKGTQIMDVIRVMQVVRNSVLGNSSETGNRTFLDQGNATGSEKKISLIT